MSAFGKPLGTVRAMLATIGFVSLNMFVGYAMSSQLPYAEKLVFAYLPLISMIITFYFMRKRPDEEVKK